MEITPDPQACQAGQERDTTAMPTARIGQLRALGNELGFDPASRARLIALKR